jgi:hypothetical protein
MPPSSDRSPSPALAPHPRRLQAAGILLFLFIPLVLWLFVRHPRPLAASLAAGIVLMIGHRFLARPYMRQALLWKCVWCNRVPPAASAEAGVASLELLTGDGVATAHCCPRHRPLAARFFQFLDLARWPLRLGIFGPLLLLLGALVAAAVGHPGRLAAATAFFQLAVGLTVSAAAWGYLLGQPGGDLRAPIAVPFPTHNFFLLGLRALLWIFRLVGAWWIVRGAAFFLV